MNCGVQWYGSKLCYSILDTTANVTVRDENSQQLPGCSHYLHPALLERRKPASMPTEGSPAHDIDCTECFPHLTQTTKHCISEECHDRDKAGNACPNSGFGCSFWGTPPEIEKHQTVCYYRLIRCAWHLQCGKHEIRLSSYKRHLEDVHRPYIKKIGLNEEVEIMLKTDSMVRTSNILRIEGTNAYFIRRCLVDLHEDTLLICVHYIGEMDEAKKYIYRLRINQGFHHAKYICTSYCLPYVENSSLCVTSPDCTLLFPSKIFLTKAYLREIHYSLTIKRL